jgi:hypothetical protein
MVVDLTAKKQAREARLAAKREAIQAQTGETAPAETVAKK